MTSASFANPVVTIACVLTDTFSGINPTHIPAFVSVQALGALIATGLFAWLLHPVGNQACDESALTIKPELAE